MQTDAVFHRDVHIPIVMCLIFIFYHLVTTCLPFISKCVIELKSLSLSLSSILYKVNLST